MLRPEVSRVSQSDRLVTAMRSGEITHGQRVRADIERVEVASRMEERALVYFCQMRGLKVLGTVEAGDGGPLPNEVELSGLEVEREGFYDIRNALISSNGRIEVELDRESRVQPVERVVIG